MYFDRENAAKFNPLQHAKRIVRAHHDALSGAKPKTIAQVLSRHVADNARWRGVHPFNELVGHEDVAAGFWKPLLESFGSLQRRESIFFAGENEIDGGASTWVASMGHLIGLFDNAWLGIPPTSRIAFIRYCTWYRVEENKITDVMMHVDIPHLMTQAGHNPWSHQTGAFTIHPGPSTNDGVLTSPQSEDESAKTLARINSMINMIGDWKSGLPLEEELALDWHDDMLWWGPTGIGSTYTIKRYAKQHAGPFRDGFTDRKRVGHQVRTAEGFYGGFFGWPSFTARPTGGFMGMPGTNKSGEFRVTDLYRRRDEKLIENWVFIDILHFWKQQGVDVLERFSTLSEK
ncbi:MAG: ester cyclase [Pseudomonadota bacterium]